MSPRSSTPVDAITDEVAALGESPVWDRRQDRLYWIDIDGRRVHRTDPSTGADEVRELDGRPGSIALTADPDRLLVSIEHAVADLQWSTGELDHRIEIEPAGTPSRMNDGRTDPAGRFWVGSMDQSSDRAGNAGFLHRVDADRSFQTMETGVGVANGLAFSPDGSVMYWADTRRLTVWAYDYDTDTGARRNGRVFLDFTDLPGKPDGACVDETGCYWVACVYGWSVLRATPDGEVDRIIELPVEKPSMPAFGGAALDTMFLTSINSGGSAPAQPGQPLAGSVLALDPGVRGVSEPLFGG